MEREVARAGAGGKVHGRRVVGFKRAEHVVEAVDHDLVGAEVGGEKEPAGGIEGDGVGVGFALALRVDARPRVLHERAGLAEGAVFADGQGSNAAAAVIRDGDMAACRGDGDMARAAAPG